MGIMNTKAYVLIETRVGTTREVARTLAKLPGVKNVDIVAGLYDIMVLAEGSDLDAIGSLVTGHIHPITDVTRTITCLVLSESI
jgi:DNA-binding Lrp family transcriptional regulator